MLFITLEDESGIANLVVWPKVFEANRRTFLGTSMMSVRGRIQREGDVVHLVVQKVTHFSAELASVGNRTSVLPLPHGRGDQARPGSGPDPRERPPKGSRAQDFVDPYGHTDELRVKSRNFH